MDEGFPTTRQYFLSISVYPIVSARVVQLNALFMDKSGMIIPVTVTTPVTVAGTKTESEIQCIDGKLISVTVSDFLGTAKEGEVYCEAFIKIGAIDTRNPLAILTRGYVFKNGPIYHPGGKDRGPTEGNGLIYHTTGIAPGAGNNYSLLLDSWESIKVINVRFLFAADANAVDRYPDLVFSTDTGTYATAGSTFQITANVSNEWNFTSLQMINQSEVGVFQYIAIDPNVIFQFNIKALGIIVRNIQAGDAITGIILTLEKFVDLRGF